MNKPVDCKLFSPSEKPTAKEIELQKELDYYKELYFTVKSENEELIYVNERYFSSNSRLQNELRSRHMNTSKSDEYKDRSSFESKQEEASLLQTRLVIMKKMYDKTVSNLKQENDYLKQLLVDFVPDTEYYKKICKF